MTDATRCPFCQATTLHVGEPGAGAPPQLITVDGESRLLHFVACTTCTSVWFRYGDA